MRVPDLRVSLILSTKFRQDSTPKECCPSLQGGADIKRIWEICELEGQSPSQSLSATASGKLQHRGFEVREDPDNFLAAPRNKSVVSAYVHLTKHHTIFCFQLAPVYFVGKRPTRSNFPEGQPSLLTLHPQNNKDLQNLEDEKKYISNRHPSSSGISLGRCSDCVSVR